MNEPTPLTDSEIEDWERIAQKHVAISGTLIAEKLYVRFTGELILRWLATIRELQQQLESRDKVIEKYENQEPSS